MIDEKRKAEDLLIKWEAIYDYTITNKALPPPQGSCEYCAGMESDCTNKRIWAKCKLCKFKVPCWTFLKLSNEHNKGSKSFDILKSLFDKTIQDVRDIFEEFYGD